MLKLLNALPYSIAFDDGTNTLTIPPGTTVTLLGDRPWTMTASNATPATLPASELTYTATVGLSNGLPVLLDVQTVDLKTPLFQGMGLILAIGLPFLALNWFKRLTSARIDD